MRYKYIPFQEPSILPPRSPESREEEAEVASTITQEKGRQKQHESRGGDGAVRPGEADETRQGDTQSLKRVLFQNLEWSPENWSLKTLLCCQLVFTKATCKALCSALQLDERGGQCSSATHPCPSPQGSFTLLGTHAGSCYTGEEHSV